MARSRCTIMKFALMLSFWLLLSAPNFAFGSPQNQAPADARKLAAPSLAHGTWRAWLDSPGGDLPFLLRMEGAGNELKAWVLNGTERISIPEVHWEHPADAAPILVLGFPHYDSEIRAQAMDIGRMDGKWKKRRGLDTWTEMKFHAVSGNEHRFLPTPMPLGMPQLAPVSGRYRIDFSSSKDPAVGIFEQDEAGLVDGTILTTTGDYRYLAGRANGNELQLSVFDGAHAFLFKARRTVPTPAGNPAHKQGGDLLTTLTGDFWSSDRWHETWTAMPDTDIQLPDAWQQVGLLPEAQRPDWRALRYPDLHNTPRRLDDDAYAGKARLIVLFGSWCPNCHDESQYLKELHQRYSERGLSILGLAFELSGDNKRDLNQLNRYHKVMQLPYPVLLAGTANKKKAAEAFPILSEVKSYPTTLFLDAAGNIRYIWSGFSGPATGTAHQKLRAEYELRIENLLAE